MYTPRRIHTQREQYALRVADLGGRSNPEAHAYDDPFADAESALMSQNSAPTTKGIPGIKPPSVPGVTPTSPGGPSPAGSSYNPSAGVEQWRPTVEEGLRRNKLPTTPDYVNKVLHQMQTESGGNPKAINNSDENAIAGHPSQGLLQTIPSTFQQHHLPGDSPDITDPQANVDAAIGYAKERYGPTLMDSSGQGMGSGHGY
jgi:hypothetical protein